MACHRFPRWLIAVVAFAATHGLAAGNVTPARIIQTSEARFPAALGLSAVSRGGAEVIINIDAGGKLADVLVSRYTHPEFAAEAVRALREWKYEPARQDGQPTGSRFAVRMDFQASGKVSTLTITETLEARFASVRREVDLLCPPQQLDRLPAPVDPVFPRHPGKLPEEAGDVRVDVDYFIDETGRPRMPVVLSSVREGFAVAAVEALSQWRFAPPTRAGHPVTVRVRQKFIFQ